MRQITLSILVTIVVGIGGARGARACGSGGLVTTQSADVGADAQRIFISYHDGVTDIVTEVGVPATTADYGVLIPVAAQPAISPNPIPSADLEALDQRTKPRIHVVSPTVDDGGCTCFPASAGGGVSMGQGIEIGAPVPVGPVTAVVLDAADDQQVVAWLAANGFAVAAADQPTIATYSAPGRYFIALRRNETAATGGPTSVGLRFRLAGDQRGLPLRFVRLGAAASVAFTVFVASDGTVVARAPFETRTIDDLNPDTVETLGYAAGIEKAVASLGGHVFVAEGSFTREELVERDAISFALSEMIGADPNRRVTRLSTILPVASLDVDVGLDAPYADPIPRETWVQAPPAGDDLPTPALALAALGLVFTRRRRAARPATPS